VLGWNIIVYTLVPQNTPGGRTPQDQPSTRGLTLEQMDSRGDRFVAGERIAVWQSGIAGLRWIDELVESGAAIADSTNGYPSVFCAKAVDVLPRLDSPPAERGVWRPAPDDISTRHWVTRRKIDRDAVAACTPDEWLLIVASGLLT
jgi:hypothetical protein